MKKLPFLFTLILLLYANTTTQAQLIKSVGVRTGWCATDANVSYSRSGYQSPERYGNLNSVYIEVQTEYLQKGNLSLLTKISCIAKGYAFHTTSGGGGTGSFQSGVGGRGGPISHTAYYLNLTVAPKFSCYYSEMTVFGFAGLQSGLLAAYDTHFQNRIYFDDPNSYNNNYKVELALNRITFGGTIGLGFGTNRKDKRINFSWQAQYLYDFTKAANYHKSYDYNGRNNFHNLEMNYQTFLLSFGVHYTFEKKV